MNEMKNHPSCLDRRLPGNLPRNDPRSLAEAMPSCSLRSSPSHGQSHGQDSLRLRMPCSTPVDTPSNIAGHDASNLVPGIPHSNWLGVANQGREKTSGIGPGGSWAGRAVLPDPQGPCLTRRQGCLYSPQMGRAGNPEPLLSFRRNIPVCSESGLPVSNPVF